MPWSRAVHQADSTEFSVRANRPVGPGSWIREDNGTHSVLPPPGSVVGSQGSFARCGTVVRIAKKEISDGPILIIGGPVALRNMQEDQL